MEIPSIDQTIERHKSGLSHNFVVYENDKMTL